MTSDFVNQKIKENKPYEDDQFPHTLNSLLEPQADNCEITHQTELLFTSAIWRRASQIYKNAIVLPKKGNIQAHQIQQGQLCNSYFISLVDIIAESEPGFLDNLFQVKSINDAGIYSINLFVDGEVQQIIVDDYLPCDPKTKVPLFAVSKTEGEIWPCLLEKAWAKLHGSYCKMRVGSPTVALAAITLGRQFQILDHNHLNENDLEKNLHKYLNKNYRLMTAHWDSQFETKGRSSLSSSVFKIKSISQGKVNLQSFCKLDEDRSLGIQEFLNQFRVTAIQKNKQKTRNVYTLKEDFSEFKSKDQEAIIASKQIRFFEFQLQNDSSIIILVSQTGNRLSSFDYIPSKFNLMLFDKDGDLVHQSQSQHYDNFFKIKSLKKNQKYVLCLSCQWQNNCFELFQKCVVTVQVDPKLSNFKISDLSQGLQLIKQIMHKHSKSMSKQTIQNDVYRVICLEPHKSFPLGYILTENDSKTEFRSALQIKSENISLIKVESQNIDLKLSANSFDVILLLHESYEQESKLKLTEKIELQLKSKEQLLEITKKEGIKQMVGDGPAFILSFIKDHQYGVLFMNSDKHHEVLLQVQFKVKNVHIDQNEFEMSLKPNSELFYQFNALNPEKQSSLTTKAKSCAYPNSVQALLELKLKEGSKVLYKKKDIGVKYNTVATPKCVYLVFETSHENKFELKFKLEGLKLQDSEDGHKCTVHIRPGQKVVKILNKKEEKCAFCFKIKLIKEK